MKSSSQPNNEADRSLTAPDELVELAVLYDHYGVLMKESKREIFEAYVLDNLSLSEIAGEYGMTRQGVYDVINRSRKKLREYEEKLHLIEREGKIISIIDGAQMNPAEKERILAEIVGI